MRQQQCSLLPRFFGLHKVCFPDRSAFYLIVMRNILFTESIDVPIHRVFDLKGSMAGRFVDTKNEKPKPERLRNGLNVDKRTCVLYRYFTEKTNILTLIHTQAR